MKHSPGFLKLTDEAKSRIREVDVSSAFERLAENKQAVLVDVREDCEWEKSHIKSAIHLGRGVIERDIEQQIPDHNREILLYCGGGFRSALAAESLQKMGYSNVWSVEGGFRAIKESGVEIDVGGAED
jgi:rhodanese-related sulfurtransferase